MERNNWRGWVFDEPAHIDKFYKELLNPNIIRYNTEVLGITGTVKSASPFDIKNVVFNDPLTIVIWADGTKTFVKRNEHDSYDPEKALAMAIAKKALGNKYKATQIISEWVEKKAVAAPEEPDSYIFDDDEWTWAECGDFNTPNTKLFVMKRGGEMDNAL